MECECGKILCAGTVTSDQCCVKRVIGRRGSDVQSGIRLENFANQLGFLTLKSRDFTLKAAQFLEAEQRFM